MIGCQNILCIAVGAIIDRPQSRYMLWIIPIHRPAEGRWKPQEII